MKNPVCQNPGCGNETRWFRNGAPKKYCSHKCNVSGYNRRRSRPRKVSEDAMFQYRSVRFLNFHGISYTDIAVSFGVSRQRAHKSDEVFTDQELFAPVS